MKRILVVVVAMLAAATLTPTPATAGPAVANGGGRGTVDGVNPFSQFGFGVTFLGGGEARGHFNCLMAGASAQPGLNLMAVRGQVTAGAVSGSIATFSGVGTVNLGNQGRVENQTFQVTITEGGPGVGKLQLTLIAPLAMVLPVETVLNGQISIR